MTPAERRATVDRRRAPQPGAKPRVPERRKAQRRKPAAQQPAKRSFVVRTQEGARRYGVAVGQKYTPESGELSRGEKGARTQQAQAALIRAGWLGATAGKGGKGDDGYFGPKTEAAVKAFQAAVGLAPTGRLDGPTAEKLLDVSPDGDPPDTGPATDNPGKGASAEAIKSGRAPGEPKPDGSKEAASKVVAYRHDYFGTQPVKARPGGTKPNEDEVPETSKGGAGLIDFEPDGAAIYADGSVYDGLGWQDGKPAKRKRESKTLLSEHEILAARRLSLLAE